jgi:hypothetical protein
MSFLCASDPTGGRACTRRRTDRAGQKMRASIARDPQIGNLPPPRDTKGTVTQANANDSRQTALLTQTTARAAWMRRLAPWATASIAHGALARGAVQRRDGGRVNPRRVRVNCAQTRAALRPESVSCARTTLLTPRPRSVSSGFPATANRRGFVGFTASNVCVRVPRPTPCAGRDARTCGRASSGLGRAGCSSIVFCARWPAAHGGTSKTTAFLIRSVE